jgi:hypothetical protein
MFLRAQQREIAVVAIAACAPLVFGCATTNRYVVDPDPSSPAVIDAFVIRGDRTAFDADAGAIDTLTLTITGIGVSGDSVTVPLDRVERLYVRDRTRDQHAIDAKPDALIRGALWRPDGDVQHVTLQSGEIVDLRRVSTTVEAQRRLVRCVPPWGAAFEITFDDIAYLQIRDTHPGRTALLIIGVVSLVSLVATAIAMSQDDFSLLGDGDW